MTIQALFGIVAGILSVITSVVYIRSIFKGETKPDRVTWWVLGFVSAMIAASYWASGARETIWLPVAYAGSFLIVAVLSLKYGEGPVYLNTLDRVSLGGAFASAIVWWSFKSPVPALFMNILTEFIGLVPTINKSYQRPWTESKISWVLATVASLLNVLAIGEWTIAIALYPIYVFVTNAFIAYFIVSRRAKRVS